jgi:Peptidase M15
VIGFSILCLTLATNATAQVQVQIVYGGPSGPSPLPDEETPSGPSAMASDVSSMEISTWIGCDYQAGYFDGWLWATVKLFVDGTKVAEEFTEGYGQIQQTAWAYVPVTGQNQQLLCTVSSNIGSAEASGTLPAACGDERDNIIEEYRAGQVAWTPSCSDFSSSGGSDHFTWSELNGGFSAGNPHNPWGIIKEALTTGLEATRARYARGGILLSSGYRCPHDNAQVGGVQQSIHMHGRAADMYSAEHPWTEDEFNLLKAAADGTSPGPVESFFWSTYSDHHYHAAW